MTSEIAMRCVNCSNKQSFLKGIHNVSCHTSKKRHSSEKNEKVEGDVQEKVTKIGGDEMDQSSVCVR